MFIVINQKRGSIEWPLYVLSDMCNEAGGWVQSEQKMQVYKFLTGKTIGLAMTCLRIERK